MIKLISRTLTDAVACQLCVGASFAQHSQKNHEVLVDDFYTPYPFVISKQQRFNAEIGESGRLDKIEGGDWWDFYMFQSPGSGQIDITFKGFDKPVALSLERRAPSKLRGGG